MAPQFQLVCARIHVRGTKMQTSIEGNVYPTRGDVCPVSELAKIFT